MVEELDKVLEKMLDVDELLLARLEKAELLLVVVLEAEERVPDRK